MSENNDVTLCLPSGIVESMRLTLTVSVLLIALATGTVSSAWAANAGQQTKTPVIDIALTESGDFVSQCQDAAGRPVAGAAVGLYLDGKLVIETTSRSQGWFKFVSIPPGPYVLRTQGWQNPVRLWPADTAPPAAGDPIVLVLKPVSPSRIKSPVHLVAGETGPEPELSFADGTNPNDPPSVGDDVPFDPFPSSPAPRDAPTTMVPEFGPAIPQPAQGEIVTMETVVPCSSPTACVTGPTVGDVITTTAAIAGLTVGTVAIYKYERRSERSRRVVSP